MKKAIFFLTVVTLLAAACGGQKTDRQAAQNDSISSFQRIAGDSALYGLACDGCTDSIIVFLPYEGGKLDTFDIIDAFQHMRVLGRPHIGDELAIIPNPQDSAEALMVINMEVLKGTWAYQVSPTLRNVENMPRKMQRRMLEHMPDSLKQLLMVPREYSLRLKRDNTASARGGEFHHTTDDMSPVEYPAVRRYTEWHLYNGMLILKADTIAGFTREGDVPHIDTVAIRFLMQDSLVLEFPDHTQSYYRKE